MSRGEGDYQSCLEWIYQQKDSMEISKYGKNLRAVKDAIAEQQTKAKVISEYRRQVDRSLMGVSQTEKDALETAYQNLVELSQKKLNCLHTMLEICNMEDYCGNLSNEFDLKAVQLVRPEQRRKIIGQETGDQTPGFLSPSSQDCIFAAKDNWSWLVRLVKCIEIHLKNAADYHQFFHDADETEIFMEDDLKKLEKTFDLEPKNGDYNDAKKLIEELEGLLVALRQWETKTTLQWDQATRILPVHMRTEGVHEATAIRSLCEYQTRDIHIREGEDLLLLDNTKTNTWKIRNNRSEEAFVPALICLIPGPYKDAVDTAVKMRLKLLTAWTNCLKRIGKKLIVFMLTVFKPVYRQDEIKLLKSIKDMERSELLRIFDFIEDTLKVHWSDNEAFINLQERILALRMILEDAGDFPLQNEGVFNALVVQITMLEKIMDKYKDLWKDWEVYKAALETSRAPEMMLMVDKWEQLQFVTKEYFTKFWQADLGLTPEEKQMTGITLTSKAGINVVPPLEQGEFMVEEIDTRANVQPSNRSERISTTVEERQYGISPQTLSGMDNKYGHTATIGVHSPETRRRNEESSTTYTESSEESEHGRRRRGGANGDKWKHDYGSSDGYTETTITSTEQRGVGSAPPGSGAAGSGSRQVDGNQNQMKEDYGSEGYSENTTTTQYTQGVAGRPPPGGAYQNRMKGGPGSGSHGYSESHTTVQGRPGSGSQSYSESQTTVKGGPGSGSQRYSESQTTVKGGPGRGSQGYSESQTTVQYNRGVGRPPGDVNQNIHSNQHQLREGYGSEGYGEHTTIKHGKGVSQPVGGNQSKLRFVEHQANYGNEWDSLDGEEVIESMEGGYTRAGTDSLNNSTDFGYATERKIAETEQIASSEMEEKKTFIISSVLDTRTNQNVSLQEAIMSGIIKPEEGIYCDVGTGESCPIPVAMSKGWIKVSFSTTKRSREKKSSIGIITVKTIREHVRPFTIRKVKDTHTGETISHEEAVKRGVLDEERGAYKDRRGRKRMTLKEAIEQGFVDVEYAAQTSPPEIVTNSYAVRAVVDRRRKNIITFSEAVQRGIILKDTGAYKDSATGEVMYVGDAIMRGFLKARVIDDPKSLDIDPRNQLVVDKTETIKKKLLQPLGVISAFRKAANTLSP